MLSIRPRFAEAILRGDKTVELRRTRIHAHAGTLVVLYSSSPTRSVLGTAVLDEIIEAQPTELWPRVKDDAGVTQIEFDQYYENAARGYGLRLRDAVPLATPTSLHSIRANAGLEPPQSFRYVNRFQVEQLTAALAN
jgi:predicted transcriptional regulator